MRAALLVLVAAAALFGASPAHAASRPPVVMIVLDEISTTSLLDRHGRIDPVRYPNFARLAADGTWFPNATASLDETGRAIMSLLTARDVRRRTTPTYANGRRNLFTIMARRYRLNVSEEVSDMCPRRLCPSARPQNRRSILRKLARGRGKRFLDWAAGLRGSSKPTFHFVHALLPHEPWEQLPSGLRFPAGRTQKRYSDRLEHFNPWLIQQRYQRHLLQVAYTDRLLGRALARLRSLGLYDRSLIVLTADNGESFGKPGSGHVISRGNAVDIALTPLLLKRPNQRSARVIHRHVRTMDVLPTIARLTRVRVPGRLDGHSVFGRAARRIPSTTTLHTRRGRRLRLGLRALRRGADLSLRLKLGLFGSGREPPGLFGIGPYPQLHGTPLSRWSVLAPGRTRAAIDSADRYRRVRRASGSIPARVMGKLTGRGAKTRLALAVALNGRIVATGPTFPDRPGGTQLFSILVPEASLREGSNLVDLYAVRNGGKLRLLTR